jgi:probable rRNA maturation factor
MSGRLDIDVLADSPAWRDGFPAAESVCRRAAVAAFDGGYHRAGQAEVGLVLSDDARVRRLNHDFRGYDRATNVLSFPNHTAAEVAAPWPPDRPLLLGDIVVAYETVVAEAVAERKDFSHHLSHLVVHGMLHLLGYDHRTQAEADEMERLETRILATLGVPNPYPPEDDRPQ